MGELQRSSGFSWTLVVPSHIQGHFNFTQIILHSYFNCLLPWVKVFRIIPEFRILRLTFNRKSASKCWIREIAIVSLIYFQRIDYLNLKNWIFSWHTASFKIGVSKALDFGNFELSPMCFCSEAIKCPWRVQRHNRYLYPAQIIGCNYFNETSGTTTKRCKHQFKRKTCMPT